MKYKVQITETLTREVYVEADNLEAAQQIVEDKYRNQEIVLDADDFSFVDFNTSPNEPNLNYETENTNLHIQNQLDVFNNLIDTECQTFGITETINKLISHGATKKLLMDMNFSELDIDVALEYFKEAEHEQEPEI